MEDGSVQALADLPVTPEASVVGIRLKAGIMIHSHTPLILLLLILMKEEVIGKIEMEEEVDQ